MEPLIDHEKRLRELEKRLNALETRSRAPRWGSWTPTVTQGVSVSTSSSAGQYISTGGLVVAVFGIAISSAGTATQRVQIGGLPVNFYAVDRVVGTADIQDVGTRYIHVAVYSRPSGVFWMIENNAADVVGIASAYTCASGDVITGTITYQAA